MKQEGGCQCGGVRYAFEGEPDHCGICHCEDCRASSGAPMTSWLAVKDSQFAVTKGKARSYHGKNGAERYFCPTCGTGLYYLNEAMLPGIVDIQSATLDNAADFPPGAQIQCAERLPWMTGLAGMPEFERWPSG